MRITVVHCWSAPRSRSTALMYAFEARGDRCVALDEPLYLRWMREIAPRAPRPYREDAERDEAWAVEREGTTARVRNAVRRLSTTGGDEDGVVFVKHMAKFAPLYDVARDRERGFEEDPDPYGASSSELVHRHVLLIRDPADAIASFADAPGARSTSCGPDELGYADLATLWSRLASSSSSSSSSSPPIVVDADELVGENVAAALRGLCEDLDIVWHDDERMLRWPAGPHACDGPWASSWYESAHRSEGLLRTSSSSSTSVVRSSYPVLSAPARLAALRAATPVYDFLRRERRRRGGNGGALFPFSYEDPRNENLLVFVGAPGDGRLYPRDAAPISPWDSIVQGGDGVWEGLRVVDGRVLSLDAHLRRLVRSARALGYYPPPGGRGLVHTVPQIKDALFRTLAANDMRDGAHVRLTLTRGVKYTSSMNPDFNVYGTTLIVLAEFKAASGGPTTYDNDAGISLVTAANRRNAPAFLDSKIHHNNMLNNILPKIQANHAGAADAVMLDPDGYVAETNATNLFLVDHRDGDPLRRGPALVTPAADHCLPGITRDSVLTLARELGLATEVRRVSLAEFHGADEVFTTGTMGGLTPVAEIDGRAIGARAADDDDHDDASTPFPVTRRLQKAYAALPRREGWATEIPPFYHTSSNLD